MPAIDAQPQAPPPGPDPLRAAIIGCGRMGGTIDDEVADYPGMLLPYGHAPAYLRAPGVALVAAADPDTARLNAFCDRFGIPGRHADWREMLAAARPAIVSVTTPAVTRAGILPGLAPAGVRAIYCEKALACSLAEADAIAAACSPERVAFNIGTSRRYHPSYRAARALIAAGEIGEARLAVAHVSGALLHTHSHTVDTLLYLLGDPEVAEVQGELSLPAGDATGRRLPADPGVVWAQLRCAGGARAFVLPAPGRYEFEVIGSRGSLQLANNGYAQTWSIRRPTGARQGGMAVWAAGPFPEHQRADSPTLCAVLELAEAVRAGAPTSGGIGVALRQTEACLAIAESHLDGGRPARLPLARRDLYVTSR